MFSNQLIDQSGRAARHTARIARLALFLSVLIALSGLAAGAHASLAAPAEEVRVTLRATGCAPAELTRSASNFQLNAENQSGEQDLTLRLLRVMEEHEEAVRDIAFPPRAAEVSEAIALPAGDYRLVVLHRPAWLLRLTLR